MIRIEIKSNQKGDSFRPKINMQHTNTLEVIFLMSVAYDLIKLNDESGVTDEEIFNAIKEYQGKLESKRKEKEI